MDDEYQYTDDNDYQYDSTGYGSYGQSYAPDSYMSSFMPEQPYEMSPVDYNNMPVMDYTPNEEYEYSPSGGYGQSFAEPGNTLWGSGTNYGFSPDPNLVTNQFMPEQYGQSTLGYDYNDSGLNPNTKGAGWGDLWDKGTNALGKLFGTAGGVGGVAASTPYLKTLLGLMAAREEKKSNQQMAAQYPQITNQMRAQTSPYDNPGAVDPNSMRGKAQAEALAAQARMNAFRDNPLSDAGYRNMSTFDAQRVARLAAANKQLTDPLSGDVIGGGSRMNSGATSIASKSYDTMRQLAILKQMQADRDALMAQSGAGQYMGMGGLEQLMTGAKYGAQGNSPYFSALGYGVNANQYANNPDLQAMMAEWKAQQGNV